MFACAACVVSPWVSSPDARGGPVQIRRVAANHVLRMVLSGNADYRQALRDSDVIRVLCRLIGDATVCPWEDDPGGADGCAQDISADALAAIVNLSDDAKCLGALMHAKVVAAVMENIMVGERAVAASVCACVRACVCPARSGRVGARRSA